MKKAISLQTLHYYLLAYDLSEIEDDRETQQPMILKRDTVVWSCSNSYIKRMIVYLAPESVLIPQSHSLFPIW